MFTTESKGLRTVSSKLSMFLTSRYDITGTRIHWLCPRCYTLELKAMNEPKMKIDIYGSANDEVSFIYTSGKSTKYCFVLK